ncbi:N-acetylmuramoyl-L-alanine amidase [bacterium]|nr:N-acetylmuramoyl-L-alanine amidase [bacterium]
MNKIILHWTAGRYYPTQYEKQFYHFLIDKDGKIHNGIYKPEDNLNCTDNKYAAHTGGGNTGAIGIALCAMENYKSPQSVGQYPITAVQFESCMNFCAKLTKKYNIEITPSKVMTHYEFGICNPDTSSAGKIDITYLPPYSWVAKRDIGNFIRTKIRWYKEKI